MAVSSTSVAANSTAAGIPASCIITNSMSGSAVKPSDTPSSRSVRRSRCAAFARNCDAGASERAMPVTLGLSRDETYRPARAPDGSAGTGTDRGSTRAATSPSGSGSWRANAQNERLSPQRRAWRVCAGCRSRDRNAVGVPLKQAVADVDRQIQPQSRALRGASRRANSRHILRCADAQRDIDCVARCLTSSSLPRSVEHRARVAKHPALLGERDAARIAGEQRPADLLLETSDLRADRGLAGWHRRR